MDCSWVPGKIYSEDRQKEQFSREQDYPLNVQRAPAFNF